MTFPPVYYFSNTFPFRVLLAQTGTLPLNLEAIPSPLDFSLHPTTAVILTIDSHISATTTFISQGFL